MSKKAAEILEEMKAEHSRLRWGDDRLEDSRLEDGAEIEIRKVEKSGLTETEDEN